MNFLNYFLKNFNFFNIIIDQIACFFNLMVALIMKINSFNILMDSVEYFAKFKNPLILKNWFIELKV